MNVQDSQSIRYYPPVRRGLIVLGGLMLIFILAAVAGFWFSGLMTNAFLFIGLMVLAIICCFPLLPLAYRFYALIRAYYDLGRDSLVIHWGLRTETIPLSRIEWMRPVSDLVEPLPLPRLPLPGAYLGIKNIEGLGIVEYLSASIRDQVLLATPEKVYVISPSRAEEFISLFYRSVEMGSLHNPTAESIRPAIILGKVWDDRLARWLVGGGFAAGLILVAIAVIVLTSVPEIHIGFDNIAAPVEKMPSIRILLLPVLNGFAYLIDVIGGTFFYRSVENRTIAYLLWGTSIFLSLSLIASVIFGLVAK